MSKSHVLTLALAGTFLLAGNAAAQSEPAPQLVGSWIALAGQDDVIDDAIELGIADMSFVTRPIARRRLRATNDVYAMVELRLVEDRVTTVLDGRAITSPADGQSIDWTREDGEEMQVATSLRSGSLAQTFTAQDGSRENLYSVSPDGRRLTLQATIRSDRLPAPIVYRLAYERVP